MNNIDKNVLEHYPGITLRFDPESKMVSYFEGAKKSSLFPEFSTSNTLSLNDFRQYIASNEKAIVENQTQSCISNNEDWCIEYPVEFQNKKLWLREKSYLTQEGDNGRPVIGLFIDEITDEKIEKQHFLDELDKANESANSKNEFFASMSHEIRTPMNAVMGMAQILGKTTLDVEQKQYVNTIMSSSNALVQIINDILDFSKIDAGKIDLLEEEVDLEFLCLEICHLLSSRAQEKYLKIYLNYQVQSCKNVFVDKGRLRQILINLIGNAIKFTETGYVELLVESNSQASSSIAEFKFSIKDTGIGISETARNNLFKAYSQADGSISQRFGGTGLGLQISQRLINLMGGNISVDSIEGEGSNFWFVLPMQSKEDAHEIQMAGKTCLLIGEDVYNNKLMNEIMQRVGVSGDVAVTSDEAYKYLSEEKLYDIFIVDSFGDRSEMMRLFSYIKSQAHYKNSAKIMLTNIGAQENQFDLFEAGVDVYIPKPVSPNLVYKAINASNNKPANICKSLYISNENISQDEFSETFDLRAKGKILIAEDVEVNQVILNSMLTQIGLETEIVCNGEEAVEKLKLNSYDLVFMDCRMPVMDGFEATSKIRDMGISHDQLTIVALTANAGESDKQACLDAGMNDFLSKPYTEKDLLNIVAKWIETESIEKIVEDGTKAGMVENEILDYVQFDCIKASLEDEFSNFALDITDKFIIYQQDIIDALKNADMDKVSDKAHSLAGVAAMIGAKQVCDIAKSIEEAGDEKDLEKSILGLSKLDAAISKTHSMIIICLNPEIEKSLLLF